MRGGFGFLPSVVINTSLEEEFLMGLDLRGHTVYDIGGYWGAFTIFFAKAVGRTGRVVTFEPNPQNFNRILDNVILNNFGNVEVRQIALGLKGGEVTLVFRNSEPGAGSIKEDFKQKILQKKAKSIKVTRDSLDDQITKNKLSKPSFIKIDVEGLEMDVLLGARKTIESCRPQLLIEIHGLDIQRKMENIQNIVDFLELYRFSIYHIESGLKVTPLNTQIAKEGHIYCT